MFTFDEEQSILRFNPWGYDDSGYKVLRNRFILTGVKHQCAICFDMIPPKTRCRAQAEVLDNQAKTFYFCPGCCEAMIADPDGEAIMARYDKGREQAESSRA